MSTGRLTSTSRSHNGAPGAEVLYRTARNIVNTGSDLTVELKELDADIKNDLRDIADFDNYLYHLNLKKSKLQQRVDENERWIKNFEKSDGGADSLEAQYKKLVDQIQHIYNTAKAAHFKGIELLIKDFQYHLAYKRWNDTFTATPYRPK